MGLRRSTQMHARGKRVISIDPLYAFSEAQIRDRVTATHDVLVERARRIEHRFVWDRIGSPDEMGRLRLRSMDEFLRDFEAGKQQGRYQNVAGCIAHPPPEPGRWILLPAHVA